MISCPFSSESFCTWEQGKSGSLEVLTTRLDILPSGIRRLCREKHWTTPRSTWHTTPALYDGCLARPWTLWLGVQFCLFFNTKKRWLKWNHTKLKELKILDCRWQTRYRGRLVGEWVMIDRKVDRANSCTVHAFLEGNHSILKRLVQAAFKRLHAMLYNEYVF